jgi:O-acetyl-ADP-ribose deacetylase (regulator of RNase III)
MSHAYRVGDLAEIEGTVHVGKILKLGIANEVMISDGYSRNPGLMPFGSGNKPIYRVGFCPFHREDDEEDDYEWVDWFHERDLTVINLLDHLALSLERADLLNFVKGDATRPQGDGPKLIVHVCNNIGAWGAGFVVAISRRWPEPEAFYREWYRNKDGGFGMGRIQSVLVDDDLYVVNMIAQHSIRGRDGASSGPPLRYPALRQCLQKVVQLAQTHQASVHMPRIGCGLAGGMWEHVQDIIEETLVLGGVKVTVYDFDG